MPTGSSVSREKLGQPLRPPKLSEGGSTFNRKLEILNRIAAENNHTGVHIKEIEPGIEDSFILLMSQHITDSGLQKAVKK
ncbi:MAG TPA: hypothetical protein VFI33_03110 [Puia sp.]|nr:hypothetical protein [Puia sp.]